VAARITVEKAGVTATYVPLIKFDRIYAALAAGDIDAGALPIDLRFSGETRYGWNAFPIHEFGSPSIFATTASGSRPTAVWYSKRFRGRRFLA
jgi:hypothetical protein